MVKNLSRTLLFLGALVMGMASSLAADPGDDPSAPNSDSGDKAAKPAAKPAAAVKAKDPVELALAIPKKYHVTYDQLRKDQKTAYDAMKKQFGHKLKDALQKVKDATDEGKGKAAKDLRSLKKQVSDKIVAILNQPDPTVKSVKQPQYRRNGRYYSY